VVRHKLTMVEVMMTRVSSRKISMREQITIFKVSEGASKLHAKHTTGMLMLGGLRHAPQKIFENYML